MIVVLMEHLVALVKLAVMVSKEIEVIAVDMVTPVHLDSLAHKVIVELKVNLVQKVNPVVQ